MSPTIAIPAGVVTVDGKLVRVNAFRMDRMGDGAHVSDFVRYVVARFQGNFDSPT